MKKDGYANLLEHHGVMMCLKEPKRCITSQHCLAAEIETEDYLLGLNPGYVHYSDWSFYKQWLDCDGVYPYTYGDRGGIYLNDIIRKLIRNETTRHAVINIWDKKVDLVHSDFVPCGTQWVFSVNNDKLDMFVTVRSQDACRGFFLDTFAYPFIQQYVSNATEIPMGNYYHIILNSHVYEDDIPFAKKLYEKLYECHSLNIEHKRALNSKEKDLMFAASKDMFINHKIHSAKMYIRRLPKFWQIWKTSQLIYAHTKYVKKDPVPTQLTCVGVIVNVNPTKDVDVSYEKKKKI